MRKGIYIEFFHAWEEGEKRNTGIYSGDYRGSVIQKEFRRGCRENHCCVGLSQGLYQPAGSRLHYFLPSMLKAKWLLCCLLAFIILPLNPFATFHQRDLLIMLILYLELIIDYQLDLFNYLNMLSPSQTWSILLFPTSRALVFLISSSLYQVELYGVFM